MTDSTFKQLHQEYQASGLNVRDFCANQDIAPSTFYYRRKKLNSQNEAPNEFVPLVVGKVPQLRNATFQDQHSFSQEDNNTNNGSLEIIYPNGTKVLVKGNFDISLLKTIVHLF